MIVRTTLQIEVDLEYEPQLQDRIMSEAAFKLQIALREKEIANKIQAEILRIEEVTGVRLQYGTRFELDMQ